MLGLAGAARAGSRGNVMTATLPGRAEGMAISVIPLTSRSVCLGAADVQPCRCC